MTSKLASAVRALPRPGNRRLKLIAVLLVLAMTAAALWGAQAKTAPSDQTEMAGKTAPGFALTDLYGSPLHLSYFKGKVVLLDFWATWCVPCRQEIPVLVSLQKTYRKEGFTVLGISLDVSGPKAVKAFARKMHINYPVAIGNTKVAADYGGIQALPTAFLIGRDGRIMKVLYGKYAKAQLADDIRLALRYSGRAAK